MCPMNSPSMTPLAVNAARVAAEDLSQSDPIAAELLLLRHLGKLRGSVPASAIAELEEALIALEISNPAPGA